MLRRLLRKVGLDLVPAQHDYSPEEREIIELVRRYTMTPPARLVGLLDAIRHIVTSRVPGDIVECGVWRGGSMMAASLALQRAGDTSRDLWLFDTFDGMVSPSAVDVSHDGTSALTKMAQLSGKPGGEKWCYSPKDEVARNMASTGYSVSKVHLVEGPVEQTLPAAAPQQIALLRLDTDWYESTRHELEHLYPRLAPGGVLILDDYGHWNGARKAVDEYFAQTKQRPLLCRLDYSARIATKLAP